MIEVEQQTINGHCKACYNLNQAFVSHANDNETLICCSCGFVTTRKALKEFTSIKKPKMTANESFMDQLIKLQEKNKNGID